MPRYIFIAGGVMSGVGKGVATASLGNILQSKGFEVSSVKIDPYVNVDAGTMNPVEHGEVFVTNDGTECDQDIGHYERFLNKDFGKVNYMTTGSVYLSVIERERNLKYKGKCVEVVPHIPEEIIARIKRAGKADNADFVLIEIGGTIGEYQNLLFLEAARMMKLATPKDVLFVMVSYLPIPKKVGEMKTKPTQTAVRTLNEAGIQPDFILARAEVPVDEPRKRKISVFCNVRPEDVISAPDVDFIYQIPLNFEKEEMGNKILEKFGLKKGKKDMEQWRSMVKKATSAKVPVRIGIVGKYFETGDFALTDSYISVIEAVKHAAWALKRKPEITWLSAEKYEKDKDALKELLQFDGVIVPGGFGKRGVEGKMKAIEFCRKKNIPYFGLCYGLQLACIEFARNVLGLKSANTTENDPKTSYPIIDVMEDQAALLQDRHYGGTMRLGQYKCRVQKGSLAYDAYQETMVSERHRHRYELNNEYVPRLENKGFVVTGRNPERNLPEIVELKGHPFFLGTQFHPELRSKPLNPHPLFLRFIKACLLKRRPALKKR
ncbi:MAG: CTP synthase [bacterium]|nr:CTP synthase [bacterium]